MIVLNPFFLLSVFVQDTPVSQYHLTLLSSWVVSVSSVPSVQTLAFSRLSPTSRTLINRFIYFPSTSLLERNNLYTPAQLREQATTSEQTRISKLSEHITVKTQYKAREVGRGGGGLGHKRIACAGIKIKAVGSRTNEREMGSAGEGDAQVKRGGRGSESIIQQQT